MLTIDEWKALLLKDFFELKQLQGCDNSTSIRRSMKQQEIGQHCCQAGENLDDLELASLKEALGLDEALWQAYKSKVRPEQEC